MLLFFLVTAGVILLDQVTKILALQYLAPAGSYPLWENVLHLTYVENTGAAFGMLQDRRWVFLVISTVALSGMIVYMFLNKTKHPLETTAVAFIVGGGIGNMIDRVLLGYVVDFIDFCLINFAIFNVADSFVCVGAGFLALWVILDSIREEKARRAALAAEEDKEEQTHE